MKRFTAPRARIVAPIDPPFTRDDVAGVIYLLRDMRNPVLAPVIAQSKDRYLLIVLRLFYHDLEARQQPLLLERDLARALVAWVTCDDKGSIDAFVQNLAELARRSKVKRVSVENDLLNLRQSLLRGCLRRLWAWEMRHI